MLTERDHVALWDGAYEHWYRRRPHLRVRRTMWFIRAKVKLPKLKHPWGAVLFYSTMVAVAVTCFVLAYITGQGSGTITPTHPTTYTTILR